ncbi:MAG: lactonase family protein [Thermoguttaceae bacterium]|nr:lactonase family protein [Thermoguttaceae bacterium]
MDRLFYVGVMNRPADLSPLPFSRGIYACALDPATGEMRRVFTEPAAVLESPTFLSVDSRRNVLYAVSSGDSDEDWLTAHRIRPDGSLELLSRAGSGGKNPCHTLVTSDGKWLFATNYSSGTTAVAALQSDGSFGDVRFQSHPYFGDRWGRQETSHPHCVTEHPGGRFLAECDLGNDRIWLWRKDPADGTWNHRAEEDFAPAPKGHGPRHAVFSPDGSRLFVFSELSCTVETFMFDATTGRLTFLASQPVLTPGTPAGQCAEIVSSADGRFLYFSSRNADVLSVFAVTPAGLSHVQQIPAGGEIPRHITFDPSGSFLLASCQKTGRIFSFRVNPQTGELTPTGHSVEVPWCACAVFAKHG